MEPVTIVIPVHNEEHTVARVIADLLAEFAGEGQCDVSIIIGDDGSTDGTAAILERVKDERVKVLAHPRRMGCGYTRRACSRLATSALVAWIDGDASYSARDVMMLCRELGANDQVIGVRDTDYGRLAWLRLATKRSISRLAAAMWKFPILDINSGLRVFRRKRLAEFIDELPDGFSCVTTSTLAALNRGHAVIQRPISYHPRATDAKSKFKPIIDTIRLLRVVFQQWSKRNT